MAKRFHQKVGIDLFETFSPVVRFTIVRVVLTISLSHDWVIRQLDINNAFLKRDLEENIYMEQL